MKVAVIGPGAVGGYFGGVLARHGDEVSMVARPGSHMDAMRANGLQLKTTWRDFTVHPKVTAPAGWVIWMDWSVVGPLLSP